MAKREVWITDNSVNFNKLRILSTKKSKPSSWIPWSNILNNKKSIIMTFS